MNAQASSTSPSGARLVDVAGRALPLLGTELRAQACNGLARVVTRQRFRNPHGEPLRVTYLLPLPADAAVAGYAFTLGEERFVAQIARREDARERFEQAILEGHSAALLEEDRSSLFTQELGNVPPGAEIEVEVELDQPLAWLPNGHWEWRFPTVVGPRYLGGDGRVPDGEKITVDVANGPVAARVRVSLEITDELVGGVPQSPSHAFEPSGGAWILVEEGGARLDRDVVVRWPVARPQPGAALAVARGSEAHARAASAFGLLTLVPPEPEHPLPALPRDLVFLVDVSGSMGGEPLAQAQRVLTALVDGLDEHDRLEILAFSSAVERWRTQPTTMHQRDRAQAQRFIAGLRAGGGTEMRTGIIEALGRLRSDAQRQVLVVTDGYVGFEAEIVAEILEQLPRGSKVHMLGVGQAVNRTLTRSASRAGGGHELIVAPGEDVEPLVMRVLAELAQPILVELEVAGSALRSCGVARLPDLHAGCPARIPVELDPAGGDLILRGITNAGAWTQRLEVAAVAPGEGSGAVLLRFARERVEDLEAARASGAEVDDAIERLGLEFGIATRRTSLVAVSSVQTVDPKAPTRSVTMPHELAAGLCAEGVGLRAAGMPLTAACFAAPPQSGGAAVGIASTMRRRGPAPMAAPAAPLPKRSGIMDSVRKLAARLTAPAHKADKELADEEQADTGTRSSTVVTIVGKLTRAGGRAIVTIAVEREIAWVLHPARAHLADGTIVELVVDLAASTSAGDLARGQTARLVFTWDDADPVSITLGEGLVITL